MELSCEQEVKTYFQCMISFTKEGNNLKIYLLLLVHMMTVFYFALTQNQNSEINRKINDKKKVISSNIVIK